jgi:Uma2 family endonuclease
MSKQLKPRITSAEYLARERQSETKSEYFDGEIFAMAGASPEHVLIVTNVAGELRAQLRPRDCRVYSTDLRVKVSATGLYTYPDVIVVCGEPRFDDEQRDTLTNPMVIVEVLSPSTQDYDRGAKFEQYRTIPSFTEYVLIAQDKFHVEHCMRQPDGRWMLAETNRVEDRIQLESIGAALALQDVYEKVNLAGG